MTPEHEALSRAMRDAVADVLKGSEWHPAEGAVLTECVVVCGWFDADGDYGTSILRCGSPWGTRGLLDHAVEWTAEADCEWTDADDD